jgi:hypothetical protein
MKELILSWLKNKGIKIWLGHGKVTSLFTYEYFRFRGLDGKYYSLDVVYSDCRVLGSVSSLNGLRLMGREGSSDGPPILSQMLEGLLKSWDSLKDFNANSVVEVNKDDLDRMINRYLTQVMNILYGISTEHFRVESVSIPSATIAVLSISYSVVGEHMLPLRINLGEVSAVRKYNFGNITNEYAQFVELITNITGGVIWY